MTAPANAGRPRQGAPARPRAARAGTAVVFCFLAFLIATWSSRIPQIKAGAGLDDGRFGLALLCAPVGSLAAVRTAGRVLERRGSRSLIRMSAPLSGIATALLPTAHGEASLLACLALFGVACGTLSTAMNAQGVEVERAYGKPLMSGFHAGYSFSALAGALLGSLAAHAGYSPLRHIGAAAAVSTVLCLAATRWLLPGASRTAGDGAPAPRTRSMLRHRTLLTLAVIVFCMLLSEAAMADWSALFLRDAAKAPAATAALGYAAFSLAMAVGRTAGNRVVAGFGPTATVRAGGTLAAASLLLALATATPAVAIAGFGLFGLGMCVIAPAAYSAAGSIPGIPSGSAIALVNGAGFVGLLAGPGLIGLVAQLAGLPVALGIPAVLAGCIVALAPAVERGDARPGTHPPRGLSPASPPPRHDAAKGTIDA